MKKIILILLFFVALLTSVMGQNVRVKAEFDSMAMWVGAQTKLTITAEYEGNRTLNFITPIDSAIEVVDFVGYDTLANGSLISVSASYLITGWDSALVYMDGLAVVDGQDTFWSNPLTLKIVDVPLDTTNAICDIKRLENADFDWHRFWILVACFVVLVVLIFVAIWAYEKYFKNRKINVGPVDQKPIDTRPAHIIALEALEHLRDENLWQAGRTKDYFSQLTDIVKEYVGRRYGISAVEQTSEDLLRELRMNTQIDIEKESVDMLKDVLEIADLVKFAKWSPLPADNEHAFEKGKAFVHKTKKEEEVKQNEVR